jgi:hypothetical protein
MYREVTMLEVKEVLRLWREGMPTKRLAAQLGLDPKTVRRYTRAAADLGLSVGGEAVSDDHVRAVLLALQPAGGRPRGDSWAQCEAQRAAIQRWLGEGLRLTKIRKLLVRQGVAIAYSTLYRFALRSWSFSLARPPRRSRCSTVNLVRNCKSTRDGSAGSRCPCCRSDGAFVRGSLPPCGRATASSIRPSRKPPRARSRPAKPRGSFSAVCSPCSFLIM